MRSKTQNPNLTQFDGELIRAARDKKEVALYFTTDAILRVLPDITCIVTVVDRYMLKVKFGVEVEQELWIQKSLLAGVKVLP
jgi:hypothetical protein